jgi:hypothetical protein
MAACDMAANAPADADKDNPLANAEKLAAGK